MKLAVLLVALICVCICGESSHFTVELERKYNHDHLVKMVNLLQKTHAELLQKESYIQVESSDNAFVAKTLLIEKHQKSQNTVNHLRANEKNHNHHEANKKHHSHHQHIATKHIILHDEERLMDIGPLTSEKEQQLLKESKTSLHPISEQMERKMESHSNHQLISKKAKTKKSGEKSVHATLALSNVANTMFTGFLSVGTAQENKFEVIFDTGSALTCIASELCHDIGCRKSRRYDREQSSTFDEIGKEVEITFGSGTLKGLINREQLEVDSLKVNKAVFIEITKQIGDAFHDGDFDGIVGLAYPHMTGVPTLFDYLINQHKLEVNEFTFHLSRKFGKSGSKLIFGGHDDKLIKGEWTYHDVSEKFYWAIPATAIYVGDNNANICDEQKPCKLVVDTGTTLLTGPSRDLRKVLAMIQVHPKCQNFYEMPPIHFEIDGKKYTLEPKEYILTLTNKGVDPPYQHSNIDDIISCAGTLFPLDIPSPQGPLWILGDVFITKYSAAFNRDTNQIGLAESKFAD